MKRNGFTLIELLAVIVILAVIAVIATPIIVGIIEDARKSAAKDAAYGVIDALELEYTKSMMSSPYTLPHTWDDVTTVIVSGTAPSAGSATLGADGKFSAASITVNGYTCTWNATNQSFNDCVAAQ